MEKIEKMQSEGKDEQALLYAWTKLGQWFINSLICGSAVGLWGSSEASWIYALSSVLGLVYSVWRLVFWAKVMSKVTFLPVHDEWLD